MRAAIARCRDECSVDRCRYVVFGSSTGLLAFYGCLGLGLRSTGYELMPFLAHKAFATARKFGLPLGPTLSPPQNAATAAGERPGGGRCLELLEGDCLGADLHDCAILLVASQVVVFGV